MKSDTSEAHVVSGDIHPNPTGNYALYSVRLRANLDLLGWAMRNKEWWRAGSLLGRMREDLDALEFYVAEKLKALPKP